MIPFVESPTHHKSYLHLPLIEEEGDDFSEKVSTPRRRYAVSGKLRQAWQECKDAPKSFVTTGILAVTIIIIVTITSFTNHTPGSYVKMYTISQKNSVRPEFIDPFGGPIELAGSHRCGSYPSEASHHGCVFDIMNYGWTANECYYEDLADAALAKGPWKWYLDPNATVEIPQDQAVLGRAVEVWTELDYHMEHCKYTQKLLARAAKDDKVTIPQELAQGAHTKHCHGLLTKPQDKSPLVVNTWVRTLYNPCVKLSQVPHSKEALELIKIK